MPNYLFRALCSSISLYLSLPLSLSLSLSPLPTSALFSLAIGMGGVFVSDRDAVLKNGFFQGYSSVVLLVICLQVSC